MGLGGILQQLKNEGVLRLYHDYRSGTLYDYSGTGNHGTATMALNKRSVRPSVAAHNVTVADSTTIRLLQGTLLLLADFTAFTATIEKRLISKRDAGGTNYDFRAVDTGITLFDGTYTRYLACRTNGAKGIAVNFSTGGVPEGFINGASAGLLSGVSAIVADDALLQIGNTAINPFAVLEDSIWAAIIVSRPLTATEHQAVYQQLQALS